MIKGIGIDIVEHDRVKDKIKNLKFIKRFLAISEIEYFNKINNDSRKIEYLASRIALKESFSKAVEKTEVELNFNEIESIKKETGQVYIKCSKVIVNAKVSISHSLNFSIAQVIIEE